MNSVERLERTIGAVRMATSAATDKRILADAEAALREFRNVNPVSESSSDRRSLRSRRWPRLASAASLVLLAGLAIVIFNRSTATAYALIQTIEANRDLRSFHARSERRTERGWETTELWAQIDDDGDMVRLRMELSHSSDGPKAIVWERDEAEVWFKARNIAVRLHEADMTRYAEEILTQCDPVVTMNLLDKAQEAGKIEIQTIEPVHEGDPIRLVSTFPGDPNWKDIYLIDPESKLVRTEESHVKEGGAFHLQRRVQYSDYNAPIAPEVFVLDLPEEVTIIDRTSPGEIGLKQDSLTAEQVSVNIAREFFEALIAKDLARAGSLFGGVPADKVLPLLHEHVAGAETYLRIVSIGKATRDAEFDTTAFMCVPCEVEVMMNGRRTVITIILGIRPVQGLPDHWAIEGTCEN